MARKLTAHVVIRDEDGRLISQGIAPVTDGAIHVQPLIDNPNQGEASQGAGQGQTSVSARLRGGK